MSKERQLIKFINELIKATITGEITWDTVNFAKYSICYETKFHDKYFILYKEGYRYFSQEFGEYEWAEKINIANIDTSNTIIWENTTNIPNLFDLFQIVQEKVSGMGDFLDSF